MCMQKIHKEAALYFFCIIWILSVCRAGRVSIILLYGAADFPHCPSAKITQHRG